MGDPVLEPLEEAWSWRELNAARSRELLTLADGVATAHQQLLTAIEDRTDALRAHRAAAPLVVWGYLCFREGRPAEALEAAGEALQLLAAQPGTLWYSRALNVRSCAQLELGEFELATLGLREQLRASRSNGDAETEGSGLHDLGVMHTRRDPAHAEGYLQAAREVFERLDHPVGRTYVAWSLGELRERQGDLDAARSFYRTALTLSRACGHLFMETLVLSRQGELELQHGDAAAGERLLREALQHQSSDPSRPLWISVPPLARLLIHTGRLTEARNLLEGQLDLARAAGMLEPQVSVHELLSEVLEALGEPGPALAHHREFSRLFRQENAEEQARKVRGLEVLHRTELAEQDARLQRQRNEELQAALAELERLHRQLERVSVTDALTGVHNRHFLMTSGQGVLQVQPRPADVAVAILDIDHFRDINTAYGHAGGDLVLRSFAQFLRAGLRENDVLVRYGGEEFVVLFPATLLGEAYGILERLRLELRQHSFSGLPAGFRMSFTAGVVNCPEADLMDALRRADALLYRGKRFGRDAVTREHVQAPRGSAAG